MSPRFDRRRDQGQGAGAGAGGGGARGGRPGRPAYGGRGGSKPYAPRGEWRPEGADRPERGERPARKPFERRSVVRPGGRFEDRQGSAGSSGGRPERSGRPEGRRFGAPRGDAAAFRPGRPAGRPAFGARAPFSERRLEGRFERRPDRRFDSRLEGRPERRVERDRPVAVEVPQGASERFNAAPADDLIWGRHAAQAALESDRPIHRIWCTSELRFQPRFLQLLREAKAGGVLVEEVTWARLGQLTDGAVHQGIVLQVAAADTLDLPTLIDGCRNLGEPPLLMALDGITDPHNLGAIVRSAEALGAHGLVLPQRRSAGLTGSVAKVAAGALEHLPVARVVNLNRSLDTLKQEGYRVIGLAGEGSVSLTEADLDGPLVIVTGSEGSGLSMLTRKHCDQLVRIPLRGATPSLNASVATAMVLYEVARRGWMKTITGSAPAPRIVRPQLPAPLATVDASTDPQHQHGLAPLQAQEPDLEPDLEPGLDAEHDAEHDAEQDAEHDAAPDPLFGIKAESSAELGEPRSEEQASAAPGEADGLDELQLGFAPAPAGGFSGDIQL